MDIAALVLAAGAGRRMGGPKALARDEHGTPWVVRTARVVAAAGCTPTVVVVGAAAEQVSAVLTTESVHLTTAEDWEEGMGASLRTGLRELKRFHQPTAALVVPVDVPTLTAEVVRRIAADNDPAALIRAVYHGTPGHPVLLGRDHWDGIIATAVGDQGARAYLRDHKPREVECSDLADGADVDSIDQLPSGHRPS